MIVENWRQFLQGITFNKFISLFVKIIKRIYLGVTCWPTQLLLGPHGKPLWVSMGEGQADWIDEIVGAMLEYYGGKGLLTGEPVIAEIASKVEGRILSYPGKVAVRGDKILVSDTGNNRILVMDKEGNIQVKITRK